jgi:hypothetical protein
MVSNIKYIYIHDIGVEEYIRSEYGRREVTIGDRVFLKQSNKCEDKF